MVAQISLGLRQGLVQAFSFVGACFVQVLAVQQVASPPESCLFLDSPAMGASGSEEGAGAGALFLHVGEAYY
jgi:hypothetical protein